MENSKVESSFKDQVQLLLKTDKNFPQKLTNHLVLESTNVNNPFQFIVQLFNEGVLCDGSKDPDGSFGLKAMMAQLAMMIASSNGAEAIGGLMKALANSGNSQLNSGLRTWVQQEFGLEMDAELSEPKGGAGAMHTPSSESPPASIQSSNEIVPFGTVLINKIMSRVEHDESKVEPPALFQQDACSNKLSKIASFKCGQKSATRGTLLVQFDKERTTACVADGSLEMRNWRSNEEEPANITVRGKCITRFQYDEEMLIIGTNEGTVHLFDTRTCEEKSSIRLEFSVISLKFVESTLVVVTSTGSVEQLWWMDISRQDMQLLNPRSVRKWCGFARQIPGIFMYLDTCFLHYSRYVDVYDTKSATRMVDENRQECFFTAPATISTLNVADLICTKRVVVAGCIDGMIAMWNTTKFMPDQRPVNMLYRHTTEEIVSLCSLNGHLLSLDKGGKLLMWSGRDLENIDCTAGPHILVEFWWDKFGWTRAMVCLLLSQE